MASDDVRRGVLLMVAAMLAFAALDGMRKGLADTVPTSVIVATRYILFAGVVLWWLHRGDVLSTKHPWLQLARSAVMAAEAAVFVIALRYATLADASAVFALAPVAGVLLAILILRETASAKTWIALAVSLAGIVIILRPGEGPGGESQQWGLWLALAAAVLYALYGVLTRKVSDEDGARTSFAWMTLVGLALALTAMLVESPAWPSPRDASLLAGAAVAAAAGQYLLIRSYGTAPAATLQPYTYFLFAWSVPISIVFFGSPPAPGVIAGALLVIGAGIWGLT